MFKNVIILLVILFLTGSSIASIVTCNLEGYVNEIRLADNVQLDGSVDIGTTFTASFVYDTEAPDLSPVLDSVGVYHIISIEINFSNYSFYHNPDSDSSPTFSIDIGSLTYYTIRSVDPAFDGTIYIDGLPKTYDDLSWEAFVIGFSFYTDTLSLPDTLPTVDTFPELSSWYSHVGRIEHDETIEKLDIIFTLTDMEVIPEPASILLLGFRVRLYCFSACVR